MDFKQMYSINVNENVEKKGRFKYLSWSHAWKWFVEQYPNATYIVVKDENNQCYFGNKEMGYMVYTMVTVDKITHEMWLPVMDHNNKAIKNPDMMAINKAVMRCLVKNLAMFGLGLYIYAGEDLPSEEDTPTPPKKTETTVKTNKCVDCKTIITKTNLAGHNKDTDEYICKTCLFKRQEGGK